MDQNFKPQGYNAVSPYFIVDGAQRLIDLLGQLFQAELLRKYEMPDGSIMHAELRIDDSVIMLGQASEQWPPSTCVMHVYVPDAAATYERAIALGCKAIEAPKQRPGDPDIRGSFMDFAGNWWSVGTQVDPAG